MDHFTAIPPRAPRSGKWVWIPIPDSTLNQQPSFTPGEPTNTDLFAKTFDYLDPEFSLFHGEAPPHAITDPFFDSTEMASSLFPDFDPNIEVPHYWPPLSSSVSTGNLSSTSSPFSFAPSSPFTLNTGLLSPISNSTNITPPQPPLLGPPAPPAPARHLPPLQPAPSSSSPSPDAPIPDLQPPYSCQKCPSTFVKRCDLSRHELKHTKPCRCELCPDFGSADLRGLHRHMWSRHREVAEAQDMPRQVSKCDFPGCKYEGRLDNLVRHARRHVKAEKRKNLAKK